MKMRKSFLVTVGVMVGMAVALVGCANQGITAYAATHVEVESSFKVDETDSVRSEDKETTELWNKLLTCYQGEVDKTIREYYVEDKRDAESIPVVASAVFSKNNTDDELVFRQVMFELTGVDEDDFVEAATLFGMADLLEWYDSPKDSAMLRELEVAWIRDDGKKYSIVSATDEAWSFRAVCYGENAGTYLYRRYLAASGRVMDAMQAIASTMDGESGLVLLPEKDFIWGENFTFEKIAEICSRGGTEHPET